MSRITFMIAEETGAMWLIGPARPIVPTTAEIASSSGSPAATSVPKARTRMISVRGSDMNSAFWRSFSPASLMAFWALTSPNCPISRPGWDFEAASTVLTAAATGPSAASESPFTSNDTSAERRSGRDLRRGLGAVGTDDCADVLRPLEAAFDVPDRGAERGITDVPVVALDEHLLAGFL